jgi:hypothetical protein
MSRTLNPQFTHKYPAAPAQKPQPQPAAKPRTNTWVRPDVHEWSGDMQKCVAAEFPSLPAQSYAAACRFDAACHDIRTYYGAENSIVETVLSKMEKRRDVVDRDLNGVIPAGLLAIVWFDLVVQIDSSECYNHFLMTLHDMGATCVQGDSHRLFSTYVALRRITKVEEEVI